MPDFHIVVRSEHIQQLSVMFADQRIGHSCRRRRDLAIFEKPFSSQLSRIGSLERILALYTAPEECSNFGSCVIGQLRLLIIHLPYAQFDPFKLSDFLDSLQTFVSNRLVAVYRIWC
jgi:hypothetical protein